MPVQRTPTGEPIPGTQVNLVDAIAYLSGVNYGSVVKVFAAMNAVLDHAKMPVSEHVLFDIVPTTPASPYDPDHKERVRQTDMFVRALVKAGGASPYEILDKPVTKFVPQAARYKAGLTD